MKNAEAERKAAASSRLSDVSVGRRALSARSIKQIFIKIKQQTVNKLKPQIFK